MSTEQQLRDWWDSLDQESRLERAKELNIWSDDEDWSGEWSTLHPNIQQERLRGAIGSMLPKSGAAAQQSQGER